MPMARCSLEGIRLAIVTLRAIARIADATLIVLAQHAASRETVAAPESDRLMRAAANAL